MLPKIVNSLSMQKPGRGAGVPLRQRRQRIRAEELPRVADLAGYGQRKARGATCLIRPLRKDLQ